MKVILYLLLYILVALIIILSIVFIPETISCANTSNAMKMPHSYRASTGCMIEYEKDKWIPLKNYRAP